MKHFYSLLLAIVAMIFPVALNAATVTINFDDPTRINLDVNYAPYPGTLVAGDNVITNCGNFTVTAKEGYILESIDWKDGTYELPIKNNSTGLVPTISDGYYTVHTRVAEEANTGIVKVDVDKAAAVSASFNETDRIVDLTDGLNELSYNPEQEKTLKIYSSATAQMPLYSVTINGTGTVSKTNNVYFVNLPVNGTVMVQSQFPPKDQYVTFSLSDGAMGFIKKITKDTPDGETLEMTNSRVKVNAGTIIYIHGNVDDYSVSSFIVDGDYTSFDNPHRVIVLEKDITVEIEATRYAQAEVTVNVNNPEMVKAYYGSIMYPGEEITLNAGDNAVVINENKNTMVFSPANMADHTLIVKVNGMALEPTVSGMFATELLYGNERIEVIATEIVRDLEAVVYLDSDEDFDWKLVSALNKNFTLTAGYNHINLCAADNQFMLNYGTGNPYVYVNDETIEAFNSIYRMNIGNGSVIKIYAATEGEPAFYRLTFAENGFNDVEVVADEIRPVTQRAGYEYAEGTKIEITPKNGKDVKVKVDGNLLTADANGKCSFIVSGAHNVEFITDDSGIVGIEAENATDSVIFNLQGIRVNNNENLPSGIYIINGKKTYIK